MTRKPQKGDRVVLVQESSARNLPVGSLGTIVRDRDLFGFYGIAWDNWSYGHRWRTSDEALDADNGWWMQPERFLVIGPVDEKIPEKSTSLNPGDRIEFVVDALGIKQGTQATVLCFSICYPNQPPSDVLVLCDPDAEGKRYLAGVKRKNSKMAKRISGTQRSPGFLTLEEFLTFTEDDDDEESCARCI